MGAEHFARASSDIVSVKFHSVSTASSEGGRSPRSAATPEGRPAERMPYGISVVERNARVIKWLYGLRQAREPSRSPTCSQAARLHAVLMLGGEEAPSRAPQEGSGAIPDP
ncbi:protein FAM110A [Meleagris gallopavo]|uniref:protein FAM110A n=1 Tax=Meleagris gallopavo TaxID=9103 RepID=UPI00093BC6AA|nr:protein FAM110A [Meleagris gallopavo]